MANKYWLGQAVPVAQVDTLTVGGTAASQTYTTTINGKDVAYTATGSQTNNEIAAAIQEALDAADIEEFGEYTFTVAANVITATGPDDGTPVTISVAVSAGTGTFVKATTTTATGPNHWSNVDNWSGGSLPVNSDNVYFRDNAVDVLYDIDQNAVTLALLDFDSTYTGKVGLPDFHGAVAGGATYSEYRETFLKIGATAVNISRGTGPGSARIRLNTGTAQTTVRLYGTAQPEQSGGVAFDFLGTHAANQLIASRGTFGVATKPGTTATIAAAKIGSQGAAVSDVQGVFGDGCTLTDLRMTGGTLEVRNGLATGLMTDGDLTISGSAGVSTSLAAHGGRVNYDTSGTLVSYYGGTGSLIDFSRIAVTRTVTAAELVPNAGWNDPGKVVTVGGSGIRVRCKLDELARIDIGEDFYLQRV